MSNTCVWSVKQYCLTTQTILFHPSNTCVLCFEHIISYYKTFFWFLSPLFCRWTKLFQICDLAKQFLSLAFTMASFERTGMPYAHQASKKVSLCISRIARKWQFSPPTPGWMRRKAFSSDSFDVLTLWQSVPTLESSHHLIRQTHRSKRKVHETALSPSNVLFHCKKNTWHQTAKPIPFSASSRHKAFL